MDMAEVYRLTELENPAKLRELFHTVPGIEKDSLVAVKLHMGELINYRFIRPAFVREIVTAIEEAGGKPFLIDTTTLYPRGRHNAVDYLETARRNGFDFSTVGAPVIIADGVTGESGVLVETGGGTREENRDCTGDLRSRLPGYINPLHRAYKRGLCRSTQEYRHGLYDEEREESRASLLDTPSGHRDVHTVRNLRQYLPLCSNPHGRISSNRS